MPHTVPTHRAALNPTSRTPAMAKRWNTRTSKRSCSNPSRRAHRTTGQYGGFRALSRQRRLVVPHRTSHRPRRDHGALTTAEVRSCFSARPASLVLGGPFLAVCPNRSARKHAEFASEEFRERDNDPSGTGNVDRPSDRKSLPAAYGRTTTSRFLSNAITRHNVSTCSGGRRGVLVGES